MPRPEPIAPVDAPSPPRRVAALIRRPVVWLLLALALGAGAAAWLRARGPAVPTTLVLRTDITRHLVASGRVRVTTRVQLAPQVAGRVTAVLVKEGQDVRPGDVLVQLDDAEARASVAQARASVEQAKGRIDQLRRVSAVVAAQASNQATTNLARAEADLARVTSLSAAGAVSRVDLEDAQRAVDIARAQKRAADAQDAAATPDGADSRVAEAALVESEARLSAALARLAQTRVVAQQAGRILTRTVEPGDTVQPGASLLEMAADGVTELVIEPDERNLAWIHLGQVARASADAYADQTFEATVTYVAPAVDARRGSVEVRLGVANPPSYLRPDMTVSVDLTVASKAGVVAVPSEALRGPTTGAQFVWAVDRGRVSRRPVTVGIRGDGHTEITSGIEPGAEIVLATDRVLDDGQRVRAARQDR
jgi:HlyD family secretion protein